MILISCPGRITYKTEKFSNQHFGKLKPMLKLQEPITQVKIKVIFRWDLLTLCTDTAKQTGLLLNFRGNEFMVLARNIS